MVLSKCISTSSAFSWLFVCSAFPDHSNASIHERARYRRVTIPWIGSSGRICLRISGSGSEFHVNHRDVGLTRLQLSTAVYWRQTYRFITMTRAGLVSIIYEQTVKLHSEDLDDSAAITLMGTDVERIVTYLRKIHEAWAAILEVAVAIWLLERQVWVACIVPLVISLGTATSFCRLALCPCCC